MTPCTWIGHDSYGDVSDQDVANNPNAVTWFAYDGDGRLTSTTQPLYTVPGTNTVLVPYTSATYDGNGNLKSTTDPLNNVTSYTYTQLNTVQTKTNPAIMVNGTMTQGVNTYSYDALGQPTQIIDPTGATSDATYDSLGHLATATAVERNPAASYTSDFNYDAAGNLLTLSTPTEVATGQILPTLEQSTYNGMGQPTATTDAVGDTTRYTYGLSGALKSITAPDGTMTVDTIDAGGRRTAVSLENVAGVVQSSTNYTYDNNGNITGLQNPNGNTTTYAYDAENNLTKQIEPVTATTSITTQFGYDASGNQVSYINGNGNLTQYTYNVWNLPEKTIEPSVPAVNLPTRTTSYDADGRPSAYTEPGAVSSSVSYDALGDLAGESGSGGEAATATRSYAYDLDGRQTSAATAAGTDTFGYNDRGLLTSTSGPSGTATFGYSGDGQLNSRTDAAGHTTYAYDAADRLSTVTDQLTGVNTAYTYDQNSRVNEIYYQSSQGALGNILSQARQTFTYGDARHDLTASTLTLGGSSSPISQNYTYDNNGNMLTRSTSGLAGPISNTYTYDKADRLSSWNNGSSAVNYGYDADGNRTAIGAQTLTYNADDQLTGTTGGGPTTSDTYDAAGNLTSQTTGSTTETMAYDAYGQMATDNGALYTYDALGRAVSTAGSTLAYSGLGTQQASDGSQFYALLPDGSPLAQQQIGASNGSGKYVLDDAHGDEVGTFNQTATAMAGSVGYDPLGNINGTQGAGLGGALGYQGDYTSPTGKVEMGSRWYSPATGQFTSRDSQTNSAQGGSAAANRYGYVSGNPLSLTDPTGHFEVPIGLKTFLEQLGEREVMTGGPEDPVGLVLTVGFLAAGIAQFFNGPNSGPAAPVTGTLSQTVGDSTVDFSYNSGTLTTVTVFPAEGQTAFFYGTDVSLNPDPAPVYVPPPNTPTAQPKPKPIPPPVPCPLCRALQPTRHPATPPVELPTAGTVTLKAPKLGAGVNPGGIAIPGEDPYRPTGAEPNPNPGSRADGDAPPPSAGDKRSPNETCQALRPANAESIGGADAWASFGDLGGPDANRSTGVTACLDETAINQGTPTGNLKPAGYQWANSYRGWLNARSSDKINNCHLLGKQLGGSGTDLRNLATCSASANYVLPTSMYQGFEEQVRKQLGAGDTVLYRVVPVYSGDRTVPYEFRMSETVWDENGDLIQPLQGFTVENTLQVPKGAPVNLGLAFNDGNPVPIGLSK